MHIAQTVASIGPVAVAESIGLKKPIERRSGARHVVARERAITQIIERQGIFPLGAGRPLEVSVVFGGGKCEVALRKGYFALPEDAERRIFGADVHGGRFVQEALRPLLVPGGPGLQAAVISDLLERLPHIGVLHGRRLDSPISGIVIAGVVISGHEQRLRLADPGRRGVKLDIAAQHVDCAVECPALQFVLQFGVVEKRILGDFGVETLIGSHGESLHRGLLVALAQITVGQVIRGVLRQCVLGARSPPQPLDGLAVTGRAVERETHQIGAVAVELAARSLESLEVFDSSVVIL